MLLTPRQRRDVASPQFTPSCQLERKLTFTLIVKKAWAAFLEREPSDISRCQISPENKEDIEGDIWQKRSTRFPMLQISCHYLYFQFKRLNENYYKKKMGL